MLLPLFALAGYDTSAHLSEETSRASVVAARGTARSVAASWAAGGTLLAALTFAVQDSAGTLAGLTGVPIAQIFLDALSHAFAKALVLIITVAQFLCGYAVTASCSRMIYAFSRGGALPGWPRWRKLTRRTRVPANANAAANANYTLAATAVALTLAALWWRFGRRAYLKHHAPADQTHDDDTTEGIIR
ncbi:amino acid permease [Streptomyces varsoviensis]|uniref:amino acid permease n=1 Tax=Streptomyces varsoviensis TaxID=67373 RepID=UPI0004CB39C6|nr:amino acid permease [Streptomyces varsoviensis]